MILGMLGVTSSCISILWFGQLAQPSFQRLGNALLYCGLVHNFCSGINQAKMKTAAERQVSIQHGFLEPVSFSHQAFDPISIDGSAIFSFGDRKHDLNWENLAFCPTRLQPDQANRVTG